MILLSLTLKLKKQLFLQHIFSAWTCYRFFKEKKSLKEAAKTCRELTINNKIIGATLAADKTQESHSALLDIIQGFAQSVYIGTTIDVREIKILILTVHFLSFC